MTDKINNSYLSNPDDDINADSFTSTTSMNNSFKEQMEARYKERQSLGLLLTDVASLDAVTPSYRKDINVADVTSSVHSRDQSIDLDPESEHSATFVGKRPGMKELITRFESRTDLQPVVPACSNVSPSCDVAPAVVDCDTPKCDISACDLPVFDTATCEIPPPSCYVSACDVPVCDIPTHATPVSPACDMPVSDCIQPGHDSTELIAREAWNASRGPVDLDLDPFATTDSSESCSLKIPTVVDNTDSTTAAMLSPGVKASFAELNLKTELETAEKTKSDAASVTESKLPRFVGSSRDTSSISKLAAAKRSPSLPRRGRAREDAAEAKVSQNISPKEPTRVNLREASSGRTRRDGNKSVTVPKKDWNKHPSSSHQNLLSSSRCPAPRYTSTPKPEGANERGERLYNLPPRSQTGIPFSRGRFNPSPVNSPSRESHIAARQRSHRSLASTSSNTEQRLRLRDTNTTEMAKSADRLIDVETGVEEEQKETSCGIKRCGRFLGQATPPPPERAPICSESEKHGDVTFNPDDQDITPHSVALPESPEGENVYITQQVDNVPTKTNFRSMKHRSPQTIPDQVSYRATSTPDSRYLPRARTTPLHLQTTVPAAASSRRCATPQGQTTSSGRTMSEHRSSESSSGNSKADRWRRNTSYSRRSNISPQRTPTIGDSSSPTPPFRLRQRDRYIPRGRDSKSTSPCWKTQSQENRTEPDDERLNRHSFHSGDNHETGFLSEDTRPKTKLDNERLKRHSFHSGDNQHAVRLSRNAMPIDTKHTDTKQPWTKTSFENFQNIVMENVSGNKNLSVEESISDQKAETNQEEQTSHQNVNEEKQEIEPLQHDWRNPKDEKALDKHPVHKLSTTDSGIPSTSELSLQSDFGALLQKSLSYQKLQIKHLEVPREFDSSFTNFPVEEPCNPPAAAVVDRLKDNPSPLDQEIAALANQLLKAEELADNDLLPPYLRSDDVDESSPPLFGNIKPTETSQTTFLVEDGCDDGECNVSDPSRPHDLSLDAPNCTTSIDEPMLSTYSSFLDESVERPKEESFLDQSVSSISIKSSPKHCFQNPPPRSDIQSKSEVMGQGDNKEPCPALRSQSTNLTTRHLSDLTGSGKDVGIDAERTASSEKMTQTKSATSADGGTSDHDNNEVFLHESEVASDASLDDTLTHADTEASHKICEQSLSGMLDNEVAFHFGLSKGQGDEVAESTKTTSPAVEKKKKKLAKGTTKKKKKKKKLGASGPEGSCPVSQQAVMKSEKKKIKKKKAKRTTDPNETTDLPKKEDGNTTFSKPHHDAKSKETEASIRKVKKSASNDVTDETKKMDAVKEAVKALSKDYKKKKLQQIRIKRREIKPDWDASPPKINRPPKYSPCVSPSTRSFVTRCELSFRSARSDSVGSRRSCSLSPRRVSWLGLPRYRPTRRLTGAPTATFPRWSSLPVLESQACTFRNAIDVATMHRRLQEGYSHPTRPCRIPISDAFKKTLASAEVMEWSLHSWTSPTPSVPDVSNSSTYFRNVYLDFLQDTPYRRAGNWGSYFAFAMVWIVAIAIVFIPYVHTFRQDLIEWMDPGQITTTLVRLFHLAMAEL